MVTAGSLLTFLSGLGVRPALCVLNTTVQWTSKYRAFTVQFYEFYSSMEGTLQFGAVDFTVWCSGLYSSVRWVLHFDAVDLTVRCSGLSSSIQLTLQFSEVNFTLRWCGLYSSVQWPLVYSAGYIIVLTIQFASLYSPVYISAVQYRALYFSGEQ